MYAASRNLYSLAITGNAPKIFAMCTKRGIPIYSVIAIFICSSLSFMVVSKSNTTATVFSWFMTVNTLSSLFNWLTLFLATLRFRKAYLSQGILPKDLPFHSPFMPYAAYYGVGMVIFFILISGFDSFFDFKSKTFIENVSYSFPLYILVRGERGRCTDREGRNSTAACCCFCFRTSDIRRLRISCGKRGCASPRRSTSSVGRQR